jgi:rhodanese-related sulfurtransferase
VTAAPAAEETAMRKLIAAMGAAALALGASAGEPRIPAAAPARAADRGAGETLDRFFMRTRGITRIVHASEVWESIHSGGKYFVVDVRPAEEYAKGHVPGAISIPIDSLFRPASLERLPPAGGKPILLVCRSGHTESMALGGLAALGYEPYVMQFGMIGWNAQTMVKAGSPRQAGDAVRGLGGPIEKASGSGLP